MDAHDRPVRLDDQRALTPWFRFGGYHFRVEVKPADLWIGAFWKREGSWPYFYHIWICLLPMLPVHVVTPLVGPPVPLDDEG